MKSKLFVNFIVLVFLNLFPFSVFGAEEIKKIKVPEPSELSGLSNKSIKSTIDDVANYILGFIVVLSILMIIVGGVWYIISAGDQDQVEDATEMVIWAVVGLVVALLGLAIVTIIGSVLKN